MGPFTAAALAALPPEVDLQDVERWEENADRLLAPPDGCWEWVGEVSWAWDVGRFGGSRGDAVVAGRTTDGLWGTMWLRPEGEERWDRREEPVHVYDAREARFAPLVGRLTGARVRVAGPDGEPLGEAMADENAEAANVLHRALDRLSGDVVSSWAEWDDERGGVVLHRAIPLEDGGAGDEILAHVFFPDGGVLPTALDLEFPEEFRTGRLPRWTIRDARVQVRGVARDGQVYPSAEAFSFGFGVFGLRFTGAQTIAWKRIAACVPSPSPAP